MHFIKIQNLYKCIETHPVTACTINLLQHSIVEYTNIANKVAQWWYKLAQTHRFTLADKVYYTNKIVYLFFYW